MGNELMVVGVAVTSAAIRALDRGRVHQARFEVSTGSETIPCQMTRSDARALERLTRAVTPGRMVVVTGMLDTRIVDVGGMRVPMLIPFVQHLEAGDVLVPVGDGVPEGTPRFRAPITFARFQAEGMVTVEPRRCRVGRAQGCAVTIRTGAQTVTWLLTAQSPSELTRRVDGVVPGAQVSTVGTLRMRSAGVGPAWLEAVSFTCRVTRGVAEARVGSAVRDARPDGDEVDEGIAGAERAVPLPTVIGAGLDGGALA